jgi:predicted DNA binding CopG/RHH family protein
MKMLDSRKKANQKWLKANYESITIRVPKGTKDKIKAWAAARNISMASYIQEACKEKSEKS